MLPQEQSQLEHFTPGQEGGVAVWPDGLQASPCIDSIKLSSSREHTNQIFTTSGRLYTRSIYREPSACQEPEAIALSIKTPNQ